MTHSATLQSLRMPGATLVTRLKVYDTLTPDKQRGGTPHVHLLCTELYFVTKGSGAVEIIDQAGFRRVELSTQSAFIFSPGTVHRLINPEGDLELFIVMQNSGLPERGDNVVTFLDDVLSDPARYEVAMQAASFEEAERRRDAGVEGFLALKETFSQSETEGQSALSQFYARAANLTRPKRRGWRAIVENSPLQEAQASLARLDALAENDTAYLQAAQQHLVEAASYRTPGFCGALNRYFDPATLELEGVTQESNYPTRAKEGSYV